MRADQLIVQRGLAPTRSAAQRLIERGAVRWRASAADWRVPRTAGEDLPDTSEIEVTDAAELRFVSRGGLKLEGALAHCGIEVIGTDCLDVGQSTGGFTDALLQHGAARVVGVDVGHGQLAEKLRGDARVTAIEGVNARAIDASSLPIARYELIVADLSFISLTLVLPALAPLLAPSGQMLLLVKPQFELQPVDIGKGGIVKHASAYPRVEARIRDACASLRLDVRDYFNSPIAGGDGNQEFFVWAAASTAAAPNRQGEAP